MSCKNVLLGILFLLFLGVFIAGCTTPSVPPSTPIMKETMVQTVLPTPTTEQTMVTTTTAVFTTMTPVVPAGKEILHETGALTTKTYNTYDFKTKMGYKFIYPKDTFRITIKSEKPVLGYAINTEQAKQLQGSQLIPRYQTYMNGIDWGLIEPSMVMEKATSSTKEFTLENVGPLTYVIDGRWMSYDSAYDQTPPFTYEIIIVKTGGPTEQNFNF